MSSLEQQLAQIEKKLQKQINNSLINEVSQHVKNKIKEHVQSDVYAAYPNPVEYTRRNLQNGSLGDIEEMNSKLISDGVLEVRDNADFNHDFASSHGGYGGVDLGKSLTYNIEYGYGNAPWSKPRPFIARTKEDLRNSGSHVKIFKEALKKRLGNDVVK